MTSNLEEKMSDPTKKEDFNAMFQREEEEEEEPMQVKPHNNKPHNDNNFKNMSSNKS